MIVFILIFSFIVLCCSCSVSALYLFPLPSTVKDSIKGYTQLAKGRVPLDVNNEAFESGENICKLSCDSDFTCKGFSTWKTLNTDMCYKYKNTPSGWSSVNQYLTKKYKSKNFLGDYFGNKGDAKIFSKNQ